MQATAQAHPIQGLIKYHGMRDDTLRYPYHDSISVSTAPSVTTTTVAFEPDAAADVYEIDGEAVAGQGAERIRTVVDHVRTLADIDHPVRLVSENTFPTNIGFGSSSSGFAAAALALVEAAGLELSLEAVSAIARRGSASAARAVIGGFSHLRSGYDDQDCRAEAIATDLTETLQVLAVEVPAFKHTAQAHAEAAESHMFDARRAHLHEQIDRMRAALHADDLSAVCALAEADTLSLAATTMTGPAGWVYWRPVTLAVFDLVRSLRTDAELPVWFSTDTGASVYVNTTPQHVEEVRDALTELGQPVHHWHVGGPARLAPDAALF
jgi:phosphomevalonate decarboxylase